MLGRLMGERRGLAVAGTHGKSTTTAMLASLLVQAGLDPTVVYGASPLGQSTGGRAGYGPWMAAEACEYRANFLHLRPEHAVILGIEPDHFDCYDSHSGLLDAFARFARLVPPRGLLLVRRDCPAARKMIARAECRTITFGLHAGADWVAEDLVCHEGRHAFSIVQGGRKLCRVQLQVPGRHNVVNALAAAALASEIGIDGRQIADGLEAFAGLRRRLEHLGSWRGVELLDDYAHHPSEVAAGLETVRQMYPGRRVWCVFQPHQVSRTAHLLDELAASLHNADMVLVAEIFRAREPDPRPGEVAAADLARRIRIADGEVPPVYRIESISRLLQTRLKPGDVLITMGAGDIRKLTNGFVDRLRQDCAAC
jgi:UDP-N-acetylmuramate--alanine ligase